MDSPRTESSQRLTLRRRCVDTSQGVRRAEQNTLLDLFLARTSTATGLDDESFLTSLDMDPTGPNGSNYSGGGGSLNSPVLGSGSGQSPHLGSLSSGMGMSMFSSLPMLPSPSGGAGSGAGSGLGLGRSSVPGLLGLGGDALSGTGATGGASVGTQANAGEPQKGKEAMTELRKFGARFSAASRLFGGSNA